MLMHTIQSGFSCRNHKQLCRYSMNTYPICDSSALRAQLHSFRDGLHYFLTGAGAGRGKFWNKLFAETVNTEINCMQVKNKVFAGRRRHKINCLQQKPLIKNVSMWKFSSPPLKKINDPSLTEISPKSPLLCVSKSPFRYGFRAGAKAIRWSVSLALISSLYRKPSQ